MPICRVHARGSETICAGEMIVGSKKVLFADEISTGLDSSTTYQIVKCMRNIVKMRRATVLMSLLQPAPETFDLFDDVMLLAEGGGAVVSPSELRVWQTNAILFWSHVYRLDTCNLYASGFVLCNQTFRNLQSFAACRMLEVS